MKALPVLAGAAGMIFVGGSVAVSGHLADAPMYTVQALRYAVACLLLLLWAHLTRRRPPTSHATRSPYPVRRPPTPHAARSPYPVRRPPTPPAPRSPIPHAARSPSPVRRPPVLRPRGREWWWLLGVTVTGLVIFNVALVQGSRHAEPAVIGVAVACVPILLAAAGPVLEGRRPAVRVLTAATVVTAGAMLVQGLGRTDATGLFWAAVTFACEAAFTLLAVPVLGRHGPLGVSVHATWLGAAMFAVLGLSTEGPAAVTRIHLDDLLAGAYLAVLVTAVAFLLWYTCVARLGTGRAGLLTGLAPIAAAATGVALGGPLPSPAVWLGITTVAAGLALGLSTPTPPITPAPTTPAPRPGWSPPLSQRR
ncbi:drug/metabolite transporter (DMT)-like permease [Actinoplanes xinjiangensis]|uniref:Drug/metabolite transporter (DMT)-like permease n=1 Tax=Actinoplanes xinjiangensis TaxID=512350 RepID=A0A316EIC1_9ACTN|nr:DMT family transporter [Actinoplanes xinjiangensis]PWK30604.1 drug/metabolite transporter (DMT)-like permease [Actinoplanes xinjiangensis]